MNRALPYQIILNTRYSNVTGTQDLTNQINGVNAQINSKILERNGIATKKIEEEKKYNQAKILHDRYRDSYLDFANKNKWSEAYEQARIAEGYGQSMQIALKNKEEFDRQISILDGEIKSLNTQKAALIDAQIAANKQALANANLTPQERAALEKQQADLDRMAKESENKSRNKKYIIIGSSIAAVIAVIGFVIYIIKKRKGAKAATGQ